MRSARQAVADKLGIEEVYGEIRPADKLALVEKFQREGHIVAMAGDGINEPLRSPKQTSVWRWVRGPMSP